MQKNPIIIPKIENTSDTKLLFQWSNIHQLTNTSTIPQKSILVIIFILLNPRTGSHHHARTHHIQVPLVCQSKDTEGLPLLPVVRYLSFFEEFTLYPSVRPLL